MFCLLVGKWPWVQLCNRQREAIFLSGGHPPKHMILNNANCSVLLSDLWLFWEVMPQSLGRFLPGLQQLLPGGTNPGPENDPHGAVGGSVPTLQPQEIAPCLLFPWKLTIPTSSQPLARLYWFPSIALNDHNLTAPHNRSVFPHSSGSRKCETKVSAGPSSL